MMDSDLVSQLRPSSHFVFLTVYEILVILVPVFLTFSLTVYVLHNICKAGRFVGGRQLLFV